MTQKEYFEKIKDQFTYLQSKIEQYDNIVVYRHEAPDFDALGSQMGMVNWLKDNFPNKEIHFVGDKHATFMPKLFPFPEDEIIDPSFFEKEHLAITIDISNLSRLAHRETLFKAKEIIKIDHHPIPEKKEEQFGDYLIVYPDRPAAAEMVALFFLTREDKYRISKDTASYLYTGIVGDTGRFMYSDTDEATLTIAASLLGIGIDKTHIYDLMYETDMRRINILKFVLNNYHVTEKGTCYYVIKKEDLEALNMNALEGSLHINTFRTIDTVRVVASITWEDKIKQYVISLRSRNLKVAPVAVKFNGGGHDFAAGCKIKSLDELPALLKELDEIEG